MELFHSPAVILIYLPAIVLAMAIEGVLYIRRNAHYPWKDSIASLIIMAGHTVSGATTDLLITAGLAVAVWHFRIATIDLGHWYSVLMLFVLIEFAYYWYHRAAHRVRVLWGSHSVHHSPNEITLSAAYRLSWTPILSGSWMFFLPMVWIGFDPVWVFGMVSASLLYQFWLHTTLIPPLGPIEWVFNTPSSHRVHHASNEEYLDRNYGGTLIVWDRLFGTFTPESPDIAIRFGLVHAATSYNPLVLVFHEFRTIVLDLWAARSWRDRIGYVFGPPGWRPAGRDAAPAE